MSNPSYDRAWLAQVLSAQHLGPCAKQTVVARVQALNGVEYVGTNGCKCPQRTCPREEQGYATGEGYHLCQEVCHQDGHAEYKAVALAGQFARGATLRVEGHTYACQGCIDFARRAGIADLVVGGGFVRLNPPEEGAPELPEPRHEDCSGGCSGPVSIAGPCRASCAKRKFA